MLADLVSQSPCPHCPTRLRAGLGLPTHLSSPSRRSSERLRGFSSPSSLLLPLLPPFHLSFPFPFLEHSFMTFDLRKPDLFLPQIVLAVSVLLFLIQANNSNPKALGVVLPFPLLFSVAAEGYLDYSCSVHGGGGGAPGRGPQEAVFGEGPAPLER